MLCRRNRRPGGRQRSEGGNALLGRALVSAAAGGPFALRVVSGGPGAPLGFKFKFKLELRAHHTADKLGAEAGLFGPAVGQKRHCYWGAVFSKGQVRSRLRLRLRPSLGPNSWPQSPQPIGRGTSFGATLGLGLCALAGMS